MENEEKKEKVEKVKKEEVKEVKKDKKESLENKQELKEGPKFKKASSEKLKKEIKDTNKKENKLSKDKVEKRKNKSGYWIAGIVLIFTLIVVSLLIFLPNSPEKSMDAFFNCLKIGDIESAKKYAIYEEKIEDIDILENDNMTQEEMQLLFNKLEWKITNLTKEGETAKIQLDITNKDFKTIISNYMKKVVKQVFSGENITEEDIEKYLIEELKNEEVKTVKKSETLELQKQNGKWKVKVNEKVVKSLLPGFEESMNSLNSIMN